MYHQLIDTGWYPCLAFLNRVTKNMDKHGCRIYTFFGNMPKSGVEGSHGDSISSFFENLQSFQSYLTSLHSQQQRGQVCLHIHPASVVICIPEDSHSDWSAMGSVSSLRCFFLEPEGAEHFFFLYFETASHYVSLAGCDLMGSACLCLMGWT